MHSKREVDILSELGLGPPCLTHWQVSAAAAALLPCLAVQLPCWALPHPLSSSWQTCKGAPLVSSVLGRRCLTHW